MRLPQCGPDQRRIGLAITIPDPWGTQLRDARASFGDVHAEQVPAHITLVPPTCVTDPDDEALAAHLRTIARDVDPFTVHLRGTGTFRPVSAVVFVQVVQGISRCEQIHRHLMSGRLAQDLPFPFHPHVTIAQEVDEANLDMAFVALAGFDATFTARHLDLYREDQGGVWHCDQQFALGHD
jgi:2'-5' RNA ligase